MKKIASFVESSWHITIHICCSRWESLLDGHPYKCEARRGARSTGLSQQDERRSLIGAAVTERESLVVPIQKAFWISIADFRVCIPQLLIEGLPKAHSTTSSNFCAHKMKIRHNRFRPFSAACRLLLISTFAAYVLLLALSNGRQSVHAPAAYAATWTDDERPRLLREGRKRFSRGSTENTWFLRHAQGVGDMERSGQGGRDLFDLL